MNIFIIVKLFSENPVLFCQRLLKGQYMMHLKLKQVMKELFRIFVTIDKNNNGNISKSKFTEYANYICLRRK